jgi:hypothetical protein
MGTEEQGRREGGGQGWVLYGMPMQGTRPHGALHAAAQPCLSTSKYVLKSIRVCMYRSLHLQVQCRPAPPVPSPAGTRARRRRWPAGSHPATSPADRRAWLDPLDLTTHAHAHARTHTHIHTCTDARTHTYTCAAAPSWGWQPLRRKAWLGPAPRCRSRCRLSTAAPAREGRRGEGRYRCR